MLLLHGNRISHGLGILLIAVAIPNLAGIIDHSIGFGHLLLSYIHFLLIAWGAWELNRYLYLKYLRLSDWLTDPVRRLLTITGICAVTSLPVAIAGLFGWYLYPGAAFIDWGRIFLTAFTVLFLMMIVTHGFETAALVRQLRKYSKYEDSASKTGKKPREPSGKPLRLTAQAGTEIIPVSQEEVAAFFTENRLVFIRTRAGQVLRTNYSLKELEAHLPPSRFFRANRQLIVSVGEVAAYQTLKDGRLKVRLRSWEEKVVTVSAANAASFKRWVSGAH